MNNNLIKSLKTLFKKAKFKIYLDADWDNIKKRRIPIICSSKIENLKELKNELLSLKINLTEINSDNYYGYYFDISNDLPALILSPKFKKESLKIHNQSEDALLVYEIEKFGNENKIAKIASFDFLSFIALMNCIHKTESEILGVSLEKMGFNKYLNSHNEFKRVFLDYKNLRKKFEYQTGGFTNNIEEFCWIYYNEIKIIADVIKERDITVHDVGTNVAQLPLLLSALPEKDLFDKNFTKIFASDDGWTGEAFVKKIIKKNAYKPVKFLKIDLTKKLNRMPAADVVIVNSVLEHLPDHNTALDVLKKLWEKTNKLLLIFVPMEKTPNTSWDHHIAFDSKIIRDLAGKLPGAVFLSDNYEINKYTLTEYGYLFAAKGL